MPGKPQTRIARLAMVPQRLRDWYPWARKVRAEPVVARRMTSQCTSQAASATLIAEISMSMLTLSLTSTPPVSRAALKATP